MKTMKTRFTTSVVFLITAAVCSANIAAQISARVNQKTPVLKTATAAWELTTESSATELARRFRAEKKNFQAIKFNSLAIIEASTSLEFVIPSGKRLTGYRRDFNQTGQIWQGFLYPTENMPPSRIGEGAWGEVIITHDGNNISGVLNESDAVYEIISGDGHQYLVEYHGEESENCLVSVDQDTTGTPDWSIDDYNKSAVDWTGSNQRLLTQSQDSGDRVDIMVVYTGATSSYFGSTAQTDLFVQTAVATTNTVFRNSRNRVQINLVGSTQIGYTESGNFATDLSWIKNSSQIAQMRDANSADLVVMIAESGNACGTSQMLTGAGIGTGSGFSIVKRSCAVGGSAFAHEIGHLFGADHDPLDSPIPPAMHVLPFAYGKAVNGQFVTLMGFFSNSVCPAYCPRVMMFSNPAVDYNGTPTGITGERDNAKVIEYTADTVANLRTSPQTITIYSPNTYVTWRRNMPRDVRWDSSGVTGNVEIQFSRDGGLTFQTIISDTPNDGVETVALMGMTTRRARIRVVSMDNRRVTDTSLNNFSLL